MARKWDRLRAIKSLSPHPDVRDGVSELQRKLSTDPAWLAAEEAEEALMKAPQLATYTAVKQWMDLHKRHPVRERVGEEGDMAEKRNRLRFRGVSQLPEVRKRGEGIRGAAAYRSGLGFIRRDREGPTRAIFPTCCI